MAIAIQVGPPVITINQGNTFLVSRYDGQIDTDGSCLKQISSPRYNPAPVG